MQFLGLISADDALCQAIAEQLKQAPGDWQQARFFSLADALSSWQERLPALLLWDAVGGDAAQAVELQKRLRASVPLPTLFVIGQVPEGFETTLISETFSRPLRLGFFLTRLFYYQSKRQQSSGAVYRLGPWVFEADTRAVKPAGGGDEVKLTDKEAELLECLCAATKPLAKDELLATIWGYDAIIDTHTLETHIYRLRRKLNDEAQADNDVFVSDRSGYAINPSWRGDQA